MASLTDHSAVWVQRTTLLFLSDPQNVVKWPVGRPRNPPLKSDDQAQQANKEAPVHVPGDAEESMPLITSTSNLTQTVRLTFLFWCYSNWSFLWPLHNFFPLKLDALELFMRGAYIRNLYNTLCQQSALVVGLWVACREFTNIPAITPTHNPSWTKHMTQTLATHACHPATCIIYFKEVVVTDDNAKLPT